MLEEEAFSSGTTAARVSEKSVKMTVRGLLTVLDKTDVTYLFTNSQLSSGNDFSDLVTFTDFSDTLAAVVPE